MAQTCHVSVRPGDYSDSRRRMESSGNLNGFPVSDFFCVWVRGGITIFSVRTIPGHCNFLTSFERLERGKSNFFKQPRYRNRIVTAAAAVQSPHFYRTEEGETLRPDDLAQVRKTTASRAQTLGLHSPPTALRAASCGCRHGDGRLAGPWGHGDVPPAPVGRAQASNQTSLCGSWFCGSLGLSGLYPLQSTPLQSLYFPLLTCQVTWRKILERIHIS